MIEFLNMFSKRLVMTEVQQRGVYEMIKRLGRCHWVLLCGDRNSPYFNALQGLTSNKIRLYYSEFHEHKKVTNPLKDPNSMYSFVNNDKFKAMEVALLELVPARCQDTKDDKPISNFDYEAWYKAHPHSQWDTGIPFKPSTSKKKSSFNK